MPSQPVPSASEQPTTSPRSTEPDRLIDRRPQVPADRLVADLVPPPRFADVRFATYVPDPAEPTQAAAVVATEHFAESLGAPSGRGLFRRRRAPEGPTGLYLDGGFGVGKTHLLASVWHAAPGPKAYGTFVELTHLVGALGFAGTVGALSGHRLLCIDEFELDDPGDTVLVSSLLERLVGHGVRVAATSNTQPGSLGEGRFDARDFLREIQGLSSHFTTVRVDGPDYRHRGLPAAPPPVTDADVTAAAAGVAGATLDSWDTLLGHLASLHPSRYGALLDGVTAVHLTGIGTVTDQDIALRVVVFADRLYDRSVPVTTSGVPLDEVFAPELLAGGYRKKYNRAISRLVALARGR
ncbi:MAG: cell division protein ZapE [Actinomycetota bacterium]|nr:cell division protein ZapE [Actinomycetota bacterium]